MWVFHPAAGFFSVVADPAKPGRLVVRARVRQDLDDLRARFLPKLTRTQETRHRDYWYRAWCSPAEWAAAVGRMAATITYTNFKSEVLQRQGPARERIYHRVWALILELDRDA